MKRLTLILCMSMCALSAMAQTEAQLRERLIGTWRLVSTEETLKDGSTRPMPAYGPDGKGFLMYQRDGYMCADLVNPNRAKWADSSHASDAEAKAAGQGTFAYCGRYEIDVKNKRIIHLPEVATDPGYVGTRQIRPYRFEGERLVLGDVEKNDPDVSRWKIVWEKVR